MIEGLIITTIAIIYVAVGLAFWSYQITTREDKGRYRLGWHPVPVISSVFWVIGLPLIVFCQYPQRLGEWFGNRALVAKTKRLEMNKLRLANKVRVESELQRIEEQLDNELDKAKTMEQQDDPLLL